ncbi:MAG: N-acetylneuraminate synthase family protein, partial [Lachnospiraceae bacterium]|nr:N-acetylneuraminate synthase family protein [Lachnospiraceae bacterium]
MQFDEMIQIQERRISKDDPVFIIGEAGVNHNGDPDLAAKLVDVACEAGVDAVKFQMFKTEDLILHNVEKAPYQKEVTDTKQTQFEMLKKLELEKETFSKLKSYCEQKGILFLCTPCDQNSLEVLDSLGVPAFKIAATDGTNIQFLRQVAAKKKPIILSAGMCYLEEIKTALRAICPINQRVILLQCTANYPLDDREVNLNVMDTLRREFDILIGYSDHARGIGAAPYAVAKGARVIEKH